jgi:hypothetical protein
MANLGGALYPFLTGLLSNARGEKVIEPVIVALFATMICFWTFTKFRFIKRHMMEGRSGSIPSSEKMKAVERAETISEN